MIAGVMIKNATKQGSMFWRVWGGVADLSFPTSKTRRGRVQGGGQICPTLMSNSRNICKLEADEVKRYRIRKLTPRESWRLMGFSDEDFDAAARVNCNTFLYAQAGGSIALNVLEMICLQMIHPQKVSVEPLGYDETIPGQMDISDFIAPADEAEIRCTEPLVAKEDDISERFKNALLNSDRVKLCGSISSGNFMIRIDDAVEILKECVRSGAVEVDDGDKETETDR